MPVPREGEERSRYIVRCMTSDEAKKKHPDRNARLAYCFGVWETESKAEGDEDGISADSHL